MRVDRYEGKDCAATGIDRSDLRRKFGGFDPRCPGGCGGVERFERLQIDVSEPPSLFVCPALELHGVLDVDAVEERSTIESGGCSGVARGKSLAELGDVGSH